MSKSKDKRIKKLKKKRIWPSLLVLFLLLICFFGIMISVVAFQVTDVVYNKIFEGVSNVEEVSNLVEQAETSDDITNLEDLLSIYADIETDV